MSWIVEERLGWTLAGDSGTALYSAYHDTDLDPANAKAAVSAFAPATLGTLPITNVEVEERGGGWWFASAKYGKAGGSGSSPATGMALVRFNTRGGTEHVTQARQHVADFGIGGPGPNFRGAIGVDQDGNVTGADFPTGTFEFEVVRYVPQSKMTSAYLGILYDLSPSVNNATFTVNVNGQVMTFAEQEVIFLGATGAQRKEGDWEMSYAFVAAKNRTGLSFGAVTGVSKKGADYLWIRYVRDKDATLKAHIMRPDSAHVERLGELKNFALLEP